MVKIKYSILVVGSLNMDMAVEVKAMPKLGETILSHSYNTIPGGKGANQAYAAGKLGGSVRMLGAIGADGFGRSLAENLSSVGVEVQELKVVDGVPSGIAIIYVDEAGGNSIVVVTGANSHCDIEYLTRQYKCMEEADIILFQMEIPTDVVYYGIRKAAERNKTIILNPAPAPAHIPPDILEKVDYLTPNETELMQLSGIHEETSDGMLRGARKLLDMGVKNVVVTLGEKGTLLVNKDQNQMFPSRAVKAADTTAAGDCFSGALSVAISEGKTVEEAIHFANMAASISVTRKGAQSSIPDRTEVEKIL